MNRVAPWLTTPKERRSGRKEVVVVLRREDDDGGTEIFMKRSELSIRCPFGFAATGSLEKRLDSPTVPP